eukprot:COSAG02_NODE_59815_length_273_cov_0.597701_1_plen_31_part_01
MIPPKALTYSAACGVYACVTQIDMGIQRYCT